MCARSQVLLPAAGLLQLQEVKRACCEFLSTQLHPTNCLGIRAFADLHACSDLLNLANTFAGRCRVSVCVCVCVRLSVHLCIVRNNTYHACSVFSSGDLFPFMLIHTEQHFPEVMQCEEFLNLGMEQVCSLIASDKLTIPSEEKVPYVHIHNLLSRDALQHRCYGNTHHAIVFFPCCPGNKKQHRRPVKMT